MKVMSLKLSLALSLSFFDLQARAAVEPKCPPVVTMPFLEEGLSPYIFLPVSSKASDQLASDELTQIGLFLWDTGTTQTTLDRKSAEFFGFNYDQPMSGTIDFGFGRTGSSFSQNGSSSNNGNFYLVGKNSTGYYQHRQNGIIGTDWIVESTSKFDVQNQTVSFWTETAWQACSDKVSGYDSIPFIQTKPEANKNICHFTFPTVSQCSVPYIQTQLTDTAGHILDIVTMIDTGRPATRTALMSGNQALFTQLHDAGWLAEPPPASGTGNKTFRLKPGLVLKLGQHSFPITDIEFFPESGEPYDRKQPIALVGMSVLKNYRSMIFDPFNAVLLLKPVSSSVTD